MLLHDATGSQAFNIHAPILETSFGWFVLGVEVD
jgi:hypothetical protein